MKKTKLYGLIFLGLILIIPATTKAANTPSGISNDYYIKLQEEKSALEYRISSLESQMTGSPAIYISTLDSRINQLKSERDAEKNYSEGMLAHNGAISMRDSVFAKIDAKYAILINGLESQKSLYQDEINRQQQNDIEIQKIKQQIIDIDKYYDAQKQQVQDEANRKNQEILDNLNKTYTPTPSINRTPTASDVFNYIDSLSLYDATVALEAIKTNALPMYTEVIKLAEAKYIKGYTTPTAMANYADTLPENEVSRLWTKLGLYNPTLRDQTNIIVKSKYPDGKFFNPAELKQQQIEASLKQTPKVTAPVATKKVTQVVEPKIEKQEATATTTQQPTIIASSTPIQVTEVKPERKSFIQKTFDFFKSFAFWR